jgi:phosphatidate phosphatase APP1
LSPEQFVRTLQSFIVRRLPANAILYKLQDLQGDGDQRPQIGLE